MLMPKRVKWRKQMRGRMKGKASRGVDVTFGEYGLQALEPGWMTARQIEAARRTLVRYMKRRGKVWIRIFPDKPVTAEAGRDPHGQGQGRRRSLGGRRQARAHHVRALRPAARTRRARPCAWRRTSCPSRRSFLERVERMGGEPAMKTARTARPVGRRDCRPRWNDAREEYFNLRFQFATGQLTDHTPPAAGAPGDRPPGDALPASASRPPQRKGVRHEQQRAAG